LLCMRFWGVPWLGFTLLVSRIAISVFRWRPNWLAFPSVSLSVLSRIILMCTSISGDGVQTGSKSRTSGVRRKLTLGSLSAIASADHPVASMSPLHPSSFKPLQLRNLSLRRSHCQTLSSLAISLVSLTPTRVLALTVLKFQTRSPLKMPFQSKSCLTGSRVR
jgi:hypothetical protein